MSTPVRLSDELLADARDAAARECRSVPQQIEYWARLGRRQAEKPAAVPASEVEPPVDQGRIAEIIAALRACGVAAVIPDPAAWQRELRQERHLPGRVP